jgi:nucleoside-diphosphate-sugar epimerase
MRVLVTGATGFIGTALAERLAARGDRLRALVRPTSRTEALERLGAELTLGDVADPAALAAAVDGCQVVVHVAGAVKVLRASEFYQANGEGTRCVAEACAGAAHPPRLVYVSSLAAAGPSRDGRPRREDDAPAPVSHYGESKLAGERAVRAVAERVEASIVRPPIVYGPRDRELMPQLLRMARLGFVLCVGSVEKRYSLVHVADLCEGILAVAERGRHVGREGAEGIYFLDGGPDHSWEEIAFAACAAAGRRARVVRVPELASVVVAAVSSLAAAVTGKASVLSLDKLKEIRESAWTCTSERARRELGYAPRFPLTEGMADAVTWFRAQGLA